MSGRTARRRIHKLAAVVHNYCVKVPLEQWDRLREVAKAEDCSCAEVTRRALDAYLGPPETWEPIDSINDLFDDGIPL